MTTRPQKSRIRASELHGRSWLNTGGKSYSISDFRGRVLLLDFWTFCCINCLHVIDELRELEERYHDVLVTVGVHSPKFVHEADPDALAAAVERYDVAHPVLDDPELTTWKAYTARAWPTLVLIDPEGYIVGHMAGEGHTPNLAAAIDQLVAEHEAKGTLHRGSGPYVPPEPTAGLLRFPAKALALPGGNLLVADAGHHRLVELAPDGETLVRTIGSGSRGRADGGPDDAELNEPNGLCLLPSDVADQVDYDVVVADTVNHLLRGVRLADGHVTTLAGTGEQFMVGAPDNVAPGDEPATEDYGPARRVRLSSPWDVTWSAQAGAVVVAMAGHHTLWTFDPLAGYVARLGGTMNEGLVDGALRQAWFAQPSGLAVADDGRLWLADSETSALRAVDVAAGEVRTAVGQGLFDFGHRDGPADQALLQHPLGVAALPGGQVAVADTYNGAVRLYDPATEEMSTLATGLAEPSGLLVDGAHLLVVESAAHRLTRIPLPDGTVARHDGAAHRTQRPVTEVAPDFTLRVVFTPPAGKKLDDRFGPSTQLSVAAETLVDGGGTGTDLERQVSLAPTADAGGHTVLSVTAKAASCDADPAVEFPACHLASQDWGIPVRVVEGGPAELVLNLHG
ncbi:redoxin domain-containing protein [Georgenia wutianyii]|uniref:Redoxin domain-containing protein n=1 Tax=Georgenia wutianyii TaxID=2585135 RepID=A0ABX5VM19_9MICO|nr:NHL domain-containing thioredoxin family protein [Georgenia wutianyii]QDB79539.1 redoxin domain-containing protein [Georgenia wutianyii]